MDFGLKKQSWYSFLFLTNHISYQPRFAIEMSAFCIMCVCWLPSVQVSPTNTNVMAIEKKNNVLL